MPELRKDPVIERWVIIATQRARRPGNFVDPEENFFEDKETCPFCHNRDTEIYTVRNNAGKAIESPWKVKVVASGTPTLNTKKIFERSSHGLYDSVNGYGTHEVVIETPKHIANMADLDVDQIQAVIETYVTRFDELKANQHFRYALAYKNYGLAAGSRRIGHSRSQIIATPVNPMRVKEKLLGAQKYFDQNKRCIYCDIIRQELELKQRIVLETQHFLAITPFASRFPFEMWILPKKHHCEFAQGVRGLEADLAKVFKTLLLKLKIGLDDPAYNYVIQSAPFHQESSLSGKWMTVEEDYHWHIELMPRLTHVAGFEKGTGFYICPIPPEDAAEFLKSVEV